MSAMDWPTTVARFEEMFGTYRTNRRPNGLRGVNFMTEQVLGHLLVHGEVVEVSTGMFLGDRLFGVTWGRLPDGSTDDRNQMCDSLDEVRTVLMAQDGFAEGES